MVTKPSASVLTPPIIEQLTARLELQKLPPPPPFPLRTPPLPPLNPPPAPEIKRRLDPPPPKPPAKS